MKVFAHRTPCSHVITQEANLISVPFCHTVFADDFFTQSRVYDTKRLSSPTLYCSMILASLLASDFQSMGLAYWTW